MGQGEKSKREEDEIFGIAPHTSKGWLVYSQTDRITSNHGSSN